MKRITRLPFTSAMALAAFAVSALQAGDYDKNPKSVIETSEEDPWAKAIRPVTNPTLFDLAVPRTQLHGIFISNSMPGLVEYRGWRAGPGGRRLSGLRASV